MYSDSRKAQRNSFAHHRAELLFSAHRAFASDPASWAATVLEGTEPVDQVASLVQHVRLSLLGPARAGAAAA